MELETEMSAAEFPQWVATRLAVLDARTDALIGRAHAAEYALAMLIGHHPDAAQLSATWRQATVELVDVEMRRDPPRSPDYWQGFQATMAAISRAVDAGCAQPPEG